MLKKGLFFLIFFLLFFGQANAKNAVIYISWDASIDDSYLESYQVYWGTSRSSVENLSTANKMNVGKKYSACVQVDDASPVYFFGVTGIDTGGLESVPIAGYHLFGNIVGDYNDGTPATSARVDGFDLAAIGIYRGQSGIIHQVIDCQGNFVIDLPSDRQKADLNRDGRVDDGDLIELKSRFGNVAQ